AAFSPRRMAGVYCRPLGLYFHWCRVHLVWRADWRRRSGGLVRPAPPPAPAWSNGCGSTRHFAPPWPPPPRLPPAPGPAIGARRPLCPGVGLIREQLSVGISPLGYAFIPLPSTRRLLMY